MGRIFLGDCRMSIHINNLTVSYQRKPAVHHIDMEFEDGSMWVIFGPNGAGKSTLLKAVMGLLKAETGSIKWQGMERKDIAYLPQQSDIDRNQPMTVLELAALGLWYEIGFFGRMNADQKKRVMQALKRVGMEEFAQRQIAHLSNGQFQRVLFARMLVQEAKFLLLDEPFNAVDARTTYALLDVLQQCSREGQAVIAVLHDYEQVHAYFPNTLLVAREKVAAGKTEEVLTDAYLQKAAALMQKTESAEWCVA
ncbi:ABC transporter ATP-binding protein [Neisseria canis]|nr:ABC transporter ATP-binding protein [Neisseria canis]